MNKLKGYRTIIFNVLLALAAIFAPTAANEVGAVFSTDEVSQAVSAITVLGNIALRFITDTPVGGEKEG